MWYWSYTLKNLIFIRKLIAKARLLKHTELIGEKSIFMLYGNSWLLSASFRIRTISTSPTIQWNNNNSSIVNFRQNDKISPSTWANRRGVSLFPFFAKIFAPSSIRARTTFLRPTRIIRETPMHMKDFNKCESYANDLPQVTA